MASRAAAYDTLIREIYVRNATGPLKLLVGPGGLPPFLAAGETVWLDRAGAAGARPGEILAIQSEGRDVRLFRMVQRRGDEIVLLAANRLEFVSAEAVLGRVSEVSRGAGRQTVDATASPWQMRTAVGQARLRQGVRRLRLKASLSSVYWDLISRFDDGVSETGDLLITERCPVGCRFCIYSCITSGQDMSEAIVRAAAASFHAAGVPLVRLLGGEPFLSLPLLLRSFRAVREVYDSSKIVVLTSGYFGTSDELVRAKMDPVVAEGLVRLHLSFDSFHLERYPIECYGRVLDYCRERGLMVTMVIHYSDALDRELDKLLALRSRHGFAVRLSTVSREGDAAALAAHETSVVGYEAFRRALFADPSLELVPEEQSCFRWTVFPTGDVHVCCKEDEKNRAGNLSREPFADIQRRVRERSSANRLNVLRFAVGHSGEISGNACLTCPLDGGLARESMAVGSSTKKVL